MMILLIFAVFLFVIGVSLLLMPNQLSRLSQFLNRKVFDETAVLTHRILAGLMCVAISALLMWLYFGHHLNHFMK